MHQGNRQAPGRNDDRAFEREVFKPSEIDLYLGLVDQTFLRAEDCDEAPHYHGVDLRLVGREFRFVGDLVGRRERRVRFDFTIEKKRCIIVSYN